MNKRTRWQKTCLEPQPVSALKAAPKPLALKFRHLSPVVKQVSSARSIIYLYFQTSPRALLYFLAQNGPQGDLAKGRYAGQYCRMGTESLLLIAAPYQTKWQKHPNGKELDRPLIMETRKLRKRTP